MMYALVLILGQNTVLDNIIKARIEMARKEQPVPPQATLPMAYQVARQQAIRQGKPLLVLVGGCEPYTCTSRGCFPIPSRFIVCRLDSFPDMGSGVIKKGILVSSPRDGDLFYLGMVPDRSTIEQIDNIINPQVIVGF